MLFPRNCVVVMGHDGGWNGYKLLGPDSADPTDPVCCHQSDGEGLKAIHSGMPISQYAKLRLQKDNAGRSWPTYACSSDTFTR